MGGRRDEAIVGNSRTLSLKNPPILTKLIAMEQMPRTLAGYRGTRGEMLVALKKAQPLTAKELATRFAVTANAVRRHLEELEGAGLVRYSREVRGVGGPVFAYRLTDRGEALFPRAYDETLAQVLEQVREREGTEGVVRLFEAQWAALAEDAKGVLDGLPLPERAQLLAEILTSRGYMAEAVTGEDGESLLREHNCAIRLVAERFPKICAAEERFLERVLGAEVERQAHIVSGANCCEYCVKGSRHGEAQGAALGAAHGNEDTGETT